MSEFRQQSYARYSKSSLKARSVSLFQNVTNKKALPLPSLPKDQISEFLEGLLPDTRLLIQPKIDGCAIAIKYVDGKLEKAISLIK